MDTKERLNIYLPTRLKRRLKEIAEDKDMKMNDLVVTAIQDMVNRMDADYSAPDLVLDRLGQVLNSEISIISAINSLNAKVDELKDE